MNHVPVCHPRLDDRGCQVILARPSKEANLARLADAGVSATFVPTSTLKEALHGVMLASWTPPGTAATVWEQLAQPAVDEPAFVLPAGMRAAAGAVVVEPDGRLWLVAPSNGFGGYAVTFPKGKADSGTSLQATAIREVWEESGLLVTLTGYIGDFMRTQTYTRFYLARRVGGTPCDMGWESQAVHLVPVSKAHGLLNRSTDRDVLKAFGTLAGRATAGAPTGEAVHDRLPELAAAYPQLFTSREFAELQSELPAGWYGLMARLCQRIAVELGAGERFCILQIKEKLGRLRIYYRGPERFFRLVDETCLASRQHCAKCGVTVTEPAVETALPVCPVHIARG